MTSTIDPELAKSFEDASAVLIDRIRQAIRGFHEAPPHGWETWERWRTPNTTLSPSQRWIPLEVVD